MARGYLHFVLESDILNPFMPPFPVCEKYIGMQKVHYRNWAKYCCSKGFNRTNGSSYKHALERLFWLDVDNGQTLTIFNINAGLKLDKIAFEVLILVLFPWYQHFSLSYRQLLK